MVSAVILTASILVSPASSAHAQVRPKVTLEVAIDTTLYRRRIDDAACTADCAAVRAKLLEPTRALFERRFGFLDWRATPAASPDTVRVTWTNDARTLDGRVLVTVLGREAAARANPHRVKFEDLTRIDGYPPTTWRDADALARRWAARLDTVLGNKSEARAVVHDALSHIALRPAVGPDLMSKAKVLVEPRAIRADPASPPDFLVRAYVFDSVGGRRDTADVSLKGCGHPATGPGYACDVFLVVYPYRSADRRYSPSDSLKWFAQRAKSKPVTLFLLRFDPDTNANAPKHQER